jgi:hypothetical protein
LRHCPASRTPGRPCCSHCATRATNSAFDYFSRQATTAQDADDWIEIFRGKERNPRAVGVLAIERALHERFGVGCRPAPSLHSRYAAFVAELIGKPDACARVVRYEDFVADRIDDPGLRQLLAGPRDVGDRFRRVLRTGQSGGWKSFCTTEDAADLNTFYGPFLRRFGYPVEAPETADLTRSATGSKYVARLIEEARGRFARMRPA